MKCVHTFGTGRHKRKADITLLFQYIIMASSKPKIIVEPTIIERSITSIMVVRNSVQADSSNS